MKVIRYPGSKHKSAAKIVDFSPKDIKVYCEPMLGSGAVFSRLFDYFEATGKPHPVYLLNDSNGPLMDLYRLVKGPERGVRELLDWRERLIPERDHVAEILEEVDHAKMRLGKTGCPKSFWLLNRVSYGAFVQRDDRWDICSVTEKTITERPSLTRCKPDDLWDARIKLQRAELFCGDWKDCLSSKTDFAYLDPPYWQPHSPNLYPGQDWTLEQHFEFWGMLKQISHSCRFLVSYGIYPFSERDFRGMGYRVIHNPLKYCNVRRSKLETSLEYLVMNY